MIIETRAYARAGLLGNPSDGYFGKNISIEDHFDSNFELESRIREKEDEVLYTQLKHIENMANIHYIRQKELNGLGDAIYHARFHCEHEPFAVLLGDTIIDSIIPVTQQLIDSYEQYGQTVVAVETVPWDRVSRYGIVGGERISDKVLNLNEMIEKPDRKQAPSNLAFAGRYILTPAIFRALEKTPRGKSNEIQLTDAMKIMLKEEGIIATIMEGKRYDIRNKLDFLKTTVEFALKRKEFAKEFEEFLRETVRDLDAQQK